MVFKINAKNKEKRRINLLTVPLIGHILNVKTLLKGIKMLYIFFK